MEISPSIEMLCKNTEKQKFTSLIDHNNGRSQGEEQNQLITGKGSNPKVEAMARYRHLCQTFVHLASEASESIEGYELAVKCEKEIIARLKDLKKKNESHDKSDLSNNIQNEPSDTVYVDNTNGTKVTGLKRKQQTRRSNIRPKSFMEKVKKKNKTSLPRSPQFQASQQISSLQVPCPPLSDTSMTMGLAEESFPSWCPSQLSQGSSHGSLTQLLRVGSYLSRSKRVLSMLIVAASDT